MTSRRSLLLFLVFLAGVAQSVYCAEPQDSTLTAGGASIRIRFTGPVTPAYRQMIEKWVMDGAAAVLTVYARFPVPKVIIVVHPAEGNRVSHGVTYAGELIRINAGTGITRDILADDWMMTHEMFHLGFPDIEESRDWMGEGLSTYMEPLARARAGQISDKEAWRSFHDGLPNGLPQNGDRGLDRTPTWGRTYWGGALFWLLADLEIRKQSSNRQSLDDVLKAIVAKGGDGKVTWPGGKVFATGDSATGLSVLTALHESMGNKPGKNELADLWKQLGISVRGKEIVFDDDAPLAAIRRAMTEPKKATAK